jgi:hypothetical protein
MRPIRPHPLPLILAAATCAAAAPATAPDPRLPDIARRLASADFADREAAQKDLEAVPYTARPALVALAAAQSDPEVKVRLEARILQIDEQLAVDPPPISLHVKNGTATDVARALSDQLGLAVTFAGADPQKLITLDAEGPFWDVCARLVPLNITRMTISRDNRAVYSGPILRNYDRAFGFAAAPLAVTLTQRVDAQAAPGADPLTSRIYLQLQVFSDPRTRVVAIAQPRITSALDDKGADLLKPVQTTGSVAMSDVSGRVSGWTVTGDLLVLPTRGKMLASVKGETRFEVQVSELRRRVDAPDKHVNEPIPLGSQQVTVMQFDVKDDMITMSIRVQPLPAIALPGGAAPPQRNVEMNLLDANGNTVWTSFVNGQMGTQLGVGRAGPFTLVMSIPDKTKTVTIPFELKNIPLPPG